MVRRRLHAHDHFGRLLVLLVLDIALSGFDETVGIRVLNATLGLLTVIVAVTVTGLRTRINGWEMVVIMGLALVSLGLGPFEGDVPAGLSSIAGGLAIGILLMAAMAEVLQHSEVNIQTLLGAICVYLLLGLMFASAYSAFHAMSSTKIFEVQGTFDATYFSFITLSTVGYGDITALGPFARRIALLEGITGQVFLATTVARLVSLYRSPHERVNGPDSP